MSPRHRFGSLLIATACTVASMAASAHAVLVESSPAVNGTLDAGHVHLILKYNSKIDHHRSRLILIGPDKSEKVLAIDAGGKSNELDASADLAQGQYTLRWQALALDGHITRGDLPFAVVTKP